MMRRYPRPRTFSALRSWALPPQFKRDRCVRRALAKDGADLSAHQAAMQQASIALHPGETYDFEVRRQQAESLSLKVISPETITNRLAARARGTARDVRPRIITEIPVIVR